MADATVKAAVVAALERADGRVSGVNPTALREALGLDCSTTQFSDALGSLIQAGTVRSHRPQPDGLNGSGDRLTTLTLTTK